MTDPIIKEQRLERFELRAYCPECGRELSGGEEHSRHGDTSFVYYCLSAECWQTKENQYWMTEQYPKIVYRPVGDESIVK